MTVEQLKADALRAQEHGAGVLVYRRPRRRGPVGVRAALLPGLNGRVVGVERETLTVMVDAQDVLGWLARREKGSMTRSGQPYREEGTR